MRGCWLALSLAIACVVADAAAQTDRRVATADAIERAALVNLRLLESPTPGDHRLAYRLLEFASDLSPSDVVLADRLAAAAWSAGDPTLLAEATQRVLSADPGNTVAQLRLITSKIERIQTIEQRLDVYERFLGPRGERFDPSIRSQLALDAAMLHRERGNLERFADRVSMAAELDPSNKQAFSLAATYYAQQTGDPVGLLELRLGLLEADPLDPNVHHAIAGSLAAENATGIAERYHANARTLLLATGGMSQGAEIERLVLRWANDGPQAVIQEIKETLNTQRERARRRYEAQLQQDVPQSELVKPEELFLGREYQRLRFLAGLAAGDDESVQTSIEAQAKVTDQVLEQLREQSVLRSEAQVDQVVEAAFVAGTELRALALIRGRADIQLPEQILQRARQRPAWINRLVVLEAWQAYRDGDTERARGLVRQVRQNEDLVLAVWLLATMAEDAGNTGEAARWYATIFQQQPLTPFGAAARAKWQRVTQSEDGLTETGRQMAALASGAPQWIDRAARDATSFMQVSAELVATGNEAGDAPRLRLSLTNLAPRALAVGPSRPLSSRFLIAPSIDDLADFAGEPKVEVIELDQRLRLTQRESVSLEIDLAAGYTGLAMLASNDRLLRHRWRAIQSFTLNPRGGLEPGPLALSAGTPKVVKPVTTGARLPADELAERIRSARGEDVLPALRAAAGWFYRSAAGVVDGDGESLADAITERYRAAAPIDRGLMLALLPSASVTPAIAPFDRAAQKLVSDAAVTGEDLDRLTIALTLLTRVNDPASPLLESAGRAGDPVTAEVARHLRRHLASGRPTLATVGPGVQALSGPGGRPTTQEEAGEPASP